MLSKKRNELENWWNIVWKLIPWQFSIPPASSDMRLFRARARSSVRGCYSVEAARKCRGSCVATLTATPDREVLACPRSLSTAVGDATRRRYGFSRVPGADEGNCLLHDTCTTRRSMRHHYPLSSPLPPRFARPYLSSARVQLTLPP